MTGDIADNEVVEGSAAAVWSAHVFRVASRVVFLAAPMNPETLVLKPRRHFSAENNDCQRIDRRLQSNVTPKKLTLDVL